MTRCSSSARRELSHLCRKNVALHRVRMCFTQLLDGRKKSERRPLVAIVGATTQSIVLFGSAWVQCRFPTWFVDLSRTRVVRFVTRWILKKKVHFVCSQSESHFVTIWITLHGGTSRLRCVWPMGVTGCREKSTKSIGKIIFPTRGNALHRFQSSQKQSVDWSPL